MCMPKLSIVENSVEFSCQISPDEALRLISQLTSSAWGVAQASISTHTPDDSLQLRNPEKIVLVAYELLEKNQAVFGRVELVEGFESKSFVIPKNLSRDISWAESSGWIAKSAKADSKWYLTEAGIQLATQGFPAQLRNKTRARRQVRSKVQY